MKKLFWGVLGLWITLGPAAFAAPTKPPPPPGRFITADAGGPYDVAATGLDGAVVSLDGTASYDPDGGGLIYRWDLDRSWDSDGDGIAWNDVDETDSSADYIFPIGTTTISLTIISTTDGVRSTDITTVTVYPLVVPLDIRPGSDKNPINMKSMGLVPVAVISTEDFDATSVDVTTIVMEGTTPVMYSYKDIDGDGYSDLLLHFITREFSLDPSQSQAILTGQTATGEMFIGIDVVRVIH